MSGVGLEKCLGVQRKNPASWRIGDRKSLGSVNFLVSQPVCGIITILIKMSGVGSTCMQCTLD